MKNALSFISLEEKQEYKDKRVKILSDATKELPNFMPKEWMDRLEILIKEAKALDVGTLPKDDIVSLIPWKKDSAPFLKKEELKKILDDSFPYHSNDFEFESIELSQSVFDEYQIKKMLAKELNLELQNANESIECWSLVRKANNRSELWLMNFFLVPGYFFIFADFGRTDHIVNFAPNGDLFKSLKKLTDYAGLDMKTTENNTWN